MNPSFAYQQAYLISTMHIQRLFNSWTDDLPKPKSTEVIREGELPEYSASEEKEEERRWRLFRIGEQSHRVDMKAIEPYKKVIRHGGKAGQERLPVFTPARSAGGSA